MPSDGRGDLKQDLPRPFKRSSISISPKMFRKRRISFTTAPPTRSLSTFSYVHISMPTLIPSSLQPEAAYISPRKAPAPPPVSASTIQGQECPDKSCGVGHNCIHSISSEWGLPSLLQLNYAARLPVTGEDGKQITFGSLFESQPTIVIFIRHFWCPLCQDYMSSVNSFLGPEMVCNTCKNGHRDIKGFGLGGRDTGTRVRFVVISNGAHGMIAKYRQIFGLSFKVYTDPSLALYQALGMGRDGDIKHHNQQTHKHSISVGSSISEKNPDISKPGEYVKHSLMGGIAMVVMRAFKVGMPVWEKGGDINQLGGEFVFGPG
jgi:alkyl-hydroperoxide reductase/thiol specific antioxidant family protein